MNRTILVVVPLVLLASGAGRAQAAPPCEEASCVPAQGAYISHFTGPNCDGVESYYLPYSSHGYQCRTYDGTGWCGTVRRAVTTRSYRQGGTCHANAWPAGNPLSDLVTVYRTDYCGEAGCVVPQGAYISHFTGADCTGTESYYLPYSSFGYQCRTWNGSGICGTVRRTVTNRSYRQNGTCHNAWPAGNPLSDFVTVYRGTSGLDHDFDGLPDRLELSLAQEFFPVLNLHCGTFEGLAMGDRRQLYGLTVPGYTNSSNGRLPFVARPYRPGGSNCPEAFQCIEIRYGIAWNWDLGDDAAPFQDHQGDSEAYFVLLARKDTDGADWGVSWSRALNDPSQWRLMKEFMSAHWMATGNSSSFRAHGNLGTTSVQRVWCAEGKHGMYPTQNACNNGGFLDADDCGDNRCDITTELFLKVQNVGELGAPLNAIIPYPGASKTLSPSGTYNVWSGEKFGTSTPYRTVFTEPLSWCPTRCY